MTRPADLGFFPVSRDRFFFVCVHKKKGRFVQSAVELYNQICKHFEAKRMTILDMYWETDAAELRKEKMRSWTENRLASGDLSWKGLLTEWEKKQLDKYMQLWNESGRGSLDDAVFVLSQNAEKRPTMSSSLGALPTVFLGHALESYLYIYIYIYSFKGQCLERSQPNSFRHTCVYIYI